MCGICGKLYFDPDRRVDAKVLIRMCEAIMHRGPVAAIWVWLWTA